MPDTAKLPLQGIRVIDLSYVFAVPYIGAILADLGAEVIKIEAPNRLDLTRGMAFARYADNDPGKDPWNRSGVYNVLNRGKLSISLDLNTERGRSILLDLVEDTDVVLENFTPRVMRKWNLEYERLREVRPSLIMLSNTGYGAGGPWSEFPSQGTTLEATMGLTQYTGYRGDKPWKVGQSYPDFLATWTGLLAILAALVHRNQTGEGQWIDLGMYQVGAALVAEPILQHQIEGTEIPRWGNEDPVHVPSNLYRAKGDDRWVAISVVSDEEWATLSRLMNEPDLGLDDRYRTEEARRARRSDVDQIVARWVEGRDALEIMTLLQSQGIACGPVFDSQDLLRNEQLRHRGFFELVTHKPDIGVRPLIGRPYRFKHRQAQIRKPAPGFGEHTREVLCDRLQVNNSTVDALLEDQVASEGPINPGEAHPWDMSESLALRTIVRVEPDYRRDFPSLDGDETDHR